MFLVDGYNVIRRISSLHNAETGGGLGAGRRALLTTLAASGILRSSRVMVVFDARGEVAAPPEASPHPMLSVRFSTPPEDADAAILSLLQGASPQSRTGVTVVTADRELAWQVRSLGARVVSPEEWEPLRTKRPQRARGKGRTERSDKPQASPADVAYWLGVFGEKGKND